MGNAYRELCHYDAAEGPLRAAIEQRFEYPEAHNNLGIVLSKRRQFSEAVHHYHCAMQQRPDYPDAHFNLALTHLLEGDFERGWAEYEWRKRCSWSSRAPFTLPEWDGRAAPGKTILLTAEQGAGDAIQFIRYAAMLRSTGSRVVLHCPEPLAPLLSLCPFVDEVIFGDRPDVTADFQASLMSLPYYFHTDLATIKAPTPYIQVPSDVVDEWSAKLDHLKAFKVGICWQGNRSYADDKLRSIPLAHFANLATVAGVQLINLQRGDGREQISETGIPVLDLGESVDMGRGSFVDTAAILQQLDLVVTSDTSIAHLAGALEVPVWVALPYSADWRWLLNRDDSPWYPSMRLFRQTNPRNWEEVFRRIRESLVMSLSTSQDKQIPAVRVSAESQNARGVDLVFNGRLDEGIACFRHALGINSDYPEAHSNLGNALRVIGRLDDARKHLEKAIELRENYPEAHHNLGLVLAPQGDLENAMACQRRSSN